MGLISNQAFEDIYVKGGLILYSFKVMIDTDTLLENARNNGYMDVVGSACNYDDEYFAPLDLDK